MKVRWWWLAVSTLPYRRYRQTQSHCGVACHFKFRMLRSYRSQIAVLSNNISSFALGLFVRDLSLAAIGARAPEFLQFTSHSRINSMLIVRWSVHIGCTHSAENRNNGNINCWRFFNLYRVCVVWCVPLYQRRWFYLDSIFLILFYDQTYASTIISAAVNDVHFSLFNTVDSDSDARPRYSI